MDHRVSTECCKNHVQGWTKLEKGWKSYYQNDHFQDMDERRFGCVKGCDCPDPWQQQALRGSKRDRQSSVSGMQAVFLSGTLPSSHSTKGSVGTGVFLPSGTRNAMEPTKKSGCSTVLLPAGVIQALKLHFDRLDRQSHCHSNTQQCSCHCSSPLQREMDMTTLSRDCDSRWPLCCGARTATIPTRVYLRSGNTDGIKRKQDRKVIIGVSD